MSDAEYRVIVLPQAQRDIRNIVLYIAKELSSPQAALNFLSAFEQAVISLAHMPSRHKTIEEKPWGDEGVRKVRVKNYYVYFLADDQQKTVKVTAVIYTGRDQKKQLSKRKTPSTKKGDSLL